MKAKEEIKKCPRCNNNYTGYGSLSRADNKTMICPTCGTDEALKDLQNYMVHQCIFEKKYCEYANRLGNTFECKAPNDEAMTCKK